MRAADFTKMVEGIVPNTNNVMGEFLKSNNIKFDLRGERACTIGRMEFVFWGDHFFFFPNGRDATNYSVYQVHKRHANRVGEINYNKEIENKLPPFTIPWFRQWAIEKMSGQIVYENIRQYVYNWAKTTVQKEGGLAEDREYIPSGKKRIIRNGIDLVVGIDGATVDIRAMTGDSQMAYVVFDRDGDTLIADDLAVEEPYKGQGIAKIMYDYVKELGFRVNRSSDQLVAGKKFWDKNKGAENNIWEQGVAEGSLNEFDYNKHVKMLNAYMKKLGYSYIGHGTDAHVFSKEAGSVTKVLIPKSGDISTAKNPFLAFLNYCKKNAGNPHLPKFTETTKEPIQLGSEKFDQVVMERLQEVDPKYEDLLVSITDSIEDGKPLDPQYQPYIKFYQTLKSVMLAGRKLGFENDIITFQSVNIMQRGNTLVIIDPWTGKGQQGVTEGLTIDVPNEQWLQDKIDYAKSKGRNEWGAPFFGTTTAYVRPNPQVSVVRLELLKGMRNEQNNVREKNLEWLMAYMEKTGKLPPDPHGNEYAPYVMVAYNGEAWVNEGNHRIMAAYKLGPIKFGKTMPVQLAYFDGGERVESGIMYPGKIGLGRPAGKPR